MLNSNLKGKSKSPTKKITQLPHWMSFFYKIHPEVTFEIEDRRAPILFKIKPFLPNPLLKECDQLWDLVQEGHRASQEAKVGIGNIWSLTFSDSVVPYFFCSEPLFPQKQNEMVTPTSKGCWRIKQPMFVRYSVNTWQMVGSTIL